MKQEDLVNEIQDKYEKLNSVDRKAILDYFISQPEKKAEKEWEAIKTSYSGDYPTLGKLRKFLIEQFPVSEESSSLIDLSQAAHKCKICGQVYANKRNRLDIVHCPRCGDNYTEIIVDASRHNIAFAQDRCFMCPLYEEEKRGTYGPSCELFGTGKTCLECKDCICKDCCHAFTLKKEMPRETLEGRQMKQKQKDWRENKKYLIQMAKNGEKFAEDMIRRRDNNIPISNNIRSVRDNPFE